MRTAPDRALAELVRASAGSDGPLSLGLVERLVFAAASADSGKALEACEAAVGLVRRARNLEDITSEQRRFFLKQLGGLRTTIRMIAFQRAEHFRATGKKDRAEEVELRLLGWCEALENQVVLDRFAELASGGVAPSATLPANFKAGNDPFASEHKPRWAEGRLAFSLGCLGTSEPFSAHVSAVPEAPAIRNPARLKRLRDRVASDCRLPGLLPGGAIWLRALFDHGSLHWWAVYHAPEGGLKVLAHDKRPADSEDKLHRANERFDRAVDNIWSAYEYGWLIDLDTWSFLQGFASTASRPAAETRLRALTQLEGRVREFLETLQACIPLFPLSRQTLARRLGEQGEMFLRGALSGRKIEEARTSLWLKELEWLRKPAGAPLRVETNLSRDLARCGALEQASKRHLRTLQELIDLSELWRVGQELRLPWQNTDILFTVQGPLWHAPLAWLPFGPPDDSRPLFESVASTSRVVSLTLRDCAEDGAALSKDLLLALWLPEEDRAHLLGLRSLHPELRSLGQERGWKVWGLAYDPEAQLPFIQAALAQDNPRFSVAVVGGHGDAIGHGVRMAGSAMFGGPQLNADLSGLDLLLLVACAVGRIEQTSDRDVEGLYAHLAAHGGRSVIAAGWKIADREAAIFAAEVVRQYLKGHNETFRRARALNRALKALLLPPERRPRVSWHLASAFALYGRG